MGGLVRLYINSGRTNTKLKPKFQASTLIIVIGFIVISEKNYLDLPQKSILCHSDKTLSEYAKSYCWIHGTSYVRKALQGKVRTWILRKPCVNIFFHRPPAVSSTRRRSSLRRTLQSPPTTSGCHISSPFASSSQDCQGEQQTNKQTNKQTINCFHFHLQLFFYSGLPGRGSLRTA